MVTWLDTNGSTAAPYIELPSREEDTLQRATVLQMISGRGALIEG
jgi:hypothetical protein